MALCLLLIGTVQIGDGVAMPNNGDINEQFGVYKSVCCGMEIVIAAGSRFPDCPKHRRLPTMWKSIADEEPIPHVSQLFGGKKRDSAA
jgi:hypothetical protein